MKTYAKIAFGLWVWSVTAALTCAQVTLTGISYTQNFDDLADSLPDGWTVYASATPSSLGTVSTFVAEKTSWANTTSGTDFRNISSDNVPTNAGTGTNGSQTTNPDRAIGWRPLAAASGARQGAVTFAINDTLGFEGFSLAVTLFTANDVAGTQTYQLEYRVGDSGSFSILDSYTAAVPFSSTQLSVGGAALADLDNQSASVYFRVRGVATSGTNLDTIGIDNFSLSYSAIPEPSTYALIFGSATMVGVGIARRRRKVGSTRDV